MPLMVKQINYKTHQPAERELTKQNRARSRMRIGEDVSSLYRSLEELRGRENVRFIALLSIHS